MYRVSQLENGLTVACAEMPHMLSVSVGIWVGVGSRFEPAHLNGACHFIEHMLFKGTKKRTASEISQAVEGIGGYLNAFTSEETTCFHARAGYKRFHEVLDVLMDMLLNSRFASGEITKERTVIKEEMAMYLDEPQHHVQELLNATLWPEQPLGRPITGTPDTLDFLTRSRLLDHLRQNYVSGGIIVVGAGNLTHRQLLKAVKNYASKFRGGKPRNYPVAKNDQCAPRLRLFSKKTEQTQMALGLRTCSRHDERRFAVRLLNTILGENMSSRLFQVLREDRGLVYSVYSTPTFFADTGDLVISAGLDTANLPKVMRLIARELRRLREKPVPVAELRRARDYVLGQIDLGQESTDNQMNWLGEQLLGYGRIFSPEETKRRLATVGSADIRSVADDFFRPSGLNVALVSPLKSERGLLASIGL
jgi:predicted Zn-dependent peptidase